ncbi:PQQ-binding-like beta-propeller repeat protein [Elizabethkingia meningoseptica]|nr:PQQ-binding-like beta-propeller repeat protein [Elizabethkingia meningoseptica]EOR30382.1 pyrrolo-quinoline quinone repeat-containing protein [Elizabethkingia meningoseptica ATCC 13253 = NBRC 12535]
MAAKDDGFNKYSNNKVLTTEDIVITDEIKPVKGNEKVLKNAIIIYKNDGTLVSYDLDSKKQNWVFKFTDGTKEKMRNQFNINNGVLYATSSKKQIVALNVNDGSMFWKNNIGLEDVEKRYAINGQNLPISKSLIFLPSFNHNLYAFNRFTGQHVWNYKLQFEFNLYAPAVNDQYLVIPNAPWVYCFETQTGKAIWQRGFKDRPMYAAPRIDSERAYVAEERDIVYALNLKNMANIDWQFQLPENQSRVKESLILGNGVLYFSSSLTMPSVKDSIKNGLVYALDSKTGKLLWQTEISEGRYIRSLQKYNDYLIGFANNDDKVGGNIFVINSKDGKKKEIKKSKEPGISNATRYDENSVAFLTRNYFTIYNFKEDSFNEQNLNIQDPANSSFDVYMEIVRK